MITFAGKVDRVVAHAKRVEAERDVLAARAAKLEVVRQSPRQLPDVERWSRDPIRGSTLRSDLAGGARARAQLALAAAEARRLEDGAAPRD